MRAVLIALLLSGCAGSERLEAQECERLLRGDAYDRSSAQALGCEE